jgi:hypothetical protein
VTQLASAKACLIGSVALLLVACAAGPPNSRPLAPRFYGVWSSTSTGNNWLEIDASRFVSFGVTQSNGRCAAIRADTVARDRVVLPVSSLGVGPMLLSLDGAVVLVVAGQYGSQRFVRASREAICRDAAGTYLPGAPYPKQGS